MKNNEHDSQTFGTFLKEARIQAGYVSLSKAIEKFNELYGSSPFSRATLNLLENDRISDINPDFIKVICECYGLSYEATIHEYIRLKYNLREELPLSSSDYIKEIRPDSFKLKPTYMSDINIEIISLNKLKQIQGAVPEKSIIGVSGNNFLDDKIYFDMILSNLKKGAKYYYYLPKDNEVSYRKLVTEISNKLSISVDKIDQNQCFFIPRGIAEFPTNNVIHIHPDSSIHAYVGITSNDIVQYYQKADNTLNWRIYQSFLMALAMSLDKEIQNRRYKIAEELMEKEEIKGFPILMESIGI